MPIWLTEFACGDHRDHRSLQKQLAYMREAVSMLERTKAVHRCAHRSRCGAAGDVRPPRGAVRRYAWMAARAASAPDYRALLVPGRAELTELGRLYNAL